MRRLHLLCTLSFLTRAEANLCGLRGVAPLTSLEPELIWFRHTGVRYMYQLRFMSGDGTAPVKEGLA